MVRLLERSFVFCLTLSFFVVSVAGQPQDRRVIVVKPGDAELKREANRLRMCPEQLANLRQALHEAVELLPGLSGAGAHVSMGHFLFRFDRRQAEGTTIKLLDELANRAREAPDYPTYMRLSASAMELTAALARVNATAAAKLEEQWPEAPMERPAGMPDGDMLSQQRFFRSIERNPEEALRQLPTVDPRVQYGARASVLRALADKGLDAEARRLVEETLAAPPESMADNAAHQYAQFASTAYQLFPDYGDQIFRVLAGVYQTLSQSGDSTQVPFSFPNGQTMQVSRADQFLLSQAMMMNSDQQFASKLAELSPAVRQRMQEAGGYGALFRWDSRQARESRRKLMEASDEEVSARFEGNKSIHELMRSAGELCFESPEKADRIFDLGLKAVLEEADLMKAINDFENMANTCDRCLGGLPEKWLSGGRALLEKARQREQETPAPLRTPDGRAVPGYGMSSRMTSSSRLEGLLISFEAETDFAGAMQEIHAIEDKDKRYQFLMRIIQRLGNR